ncbi:MFS transporter [Acidianus sulfidivorans JP7]|uniref:MFS transporter n=2 Tax=Acidianus TaxID=12914 RepID=A0A2U9IQD2_9CREN|nr:MFS transporter [Acidianus sulfidivorans JP7]
MGANSIIISLYLLSLGLSAFEIGELLSLGILVGAIISLIFSFMGDKYGRKKFAILSRIISTTAIFFLFLGYPLAYIFSSGWGSGALLFSLLGEYKDFKRLLGIRSSLSILFSVFGSLLPIFMTYREILLFEILVNVLALILLLPIREKYKGSKNTRLSSLITVSKFSTEAIIGLGAGLVIPLMSLWFYLKFGIPSSQMSPIFAISELTLSASSYLSVKISDKLGEIKTIIYFHSIAIILLFILPFSISFLMASVIFISRNVLMNMTSPVFEGLILRLIPENERSRANGIINFMEAIPRAIGPSIGGYFFNLGNLYLPFILTGSLYSISTILFFILFRKENI